MKISEIEERLARGECSEELIAEFKTALKRVPKNNRCQHCYTTAASMSIEYYDQAIELINFGLDQCGDCWPHRMLSYHNAAIIYENKGGYKNALELYKKAHDAVTDDKRRLYEPEYAAHMMRMEMHLSKFEYTADLQKYYETAVCADEFKRNFQKWKFYIALAEVIIFMHRGDKNRAKNAYDNAMNILRPDSEGALTAMLRRHCYIESSGATKEAVGFLKQLSFE